FLGLQALAVLPLTIPLALVAVGEAWRSARLLFWCFVSMIAFFFVIAWMRIVHLMWPLPAYLGLTVVMAGAKGRVAEFYARRWRGVLGAALVLLAAATVHLAVFLPWISPVQGL